LLSQQIGLGRRGWVLAVFFPRSVGHLACFDKAPMNAFSRAQAEVIADGGRDIDSGRAVLGIFGGLVAEHEFPVIGHPRATIFPLREATATTIIDLDPATFADRFSGFWLRPCKPRDDFGSFWLVGVGTRNVVVRQGDVEWVEFRDESLRTEVASGMVCDAI